VRFPHVGKSHADAFPPQRDPDLAVHRHECSGLCVIFLDGLRGRAVLTEVQDPQPASLSPMNALLALWMPILLSAVVVFVISSLVHMVFKWHASDYGRLANEDAVRDALRAGGIAPGRYVLPHCADMKDMGSEAMLKKYREGPVGHLTIAPSGVPSMGKYLLSWFLFTVVISAVVAAIASQVHGLDPARASAAAWLIGVVSFIAYGFGTITESIWMSRPWSTSVKYLLDSALYAAGTAAVFLWLWP